MHRDLKPANVRVTPAAVSLLLDDMEGEWGDRHEIFLRVAQTLEQMRAMGMPLPEDLVRMEEKLAAEFADDAKDAKDTNDTNDT